MTGVWNKGLSWKSQDGYGSRVSISTADTAATVLYVHHSLDQDQKFVVNSVKVLTMPSYTVGYRSRACPAWMWLVVVLLSYLHYFGILVTESYAHLMSVIEEVVHLCIADVYRIEIAAVWTRLSTEWLLKQALFDSDVSNVQLFFSVGTLMIRMADVQKVNCEPGFWWLTRLTCSCPTTCSQFWSDLRETHDPVRRRLVQSPLSAPCRNAIWMN